MLSVQGSMPSTPFFGTMSCPFVATAPYANLGRTQRLTRFLHSPTQSPLTLGVCQLVIFFSFCFSCIPFLVFLVFLVSFFPLLVFQIIRRFYRFLIKFIVILCFLVEQATSMLVRILRQSVEFALCWLEKSEFHHNKHGIHQVCFTLLYFVEVHADLTIFVYFSPFTFFSSSLKLLCLIDASLSGPQQPVVIFNTQQEFIS